MAELDATTFAELGRIHDELTQAELADDPRAIALARTRLTHLVDARLLGELLAGTRPTLPAQLRLPVPYYGGKFKAAPLIERAMGPIVNLVIPFGGSLGSLLGRSAPARVETVNDKDGLIVNAWRAMKLAPFALAQACAMPAHEVTLEAAARSLLDDRERLTTLLRQDPLAHDVQAAAYWLWGRSVYVGSGWCNPGKDGRPRKARVALRGGQTGPGIGQGVLGSKIRDELPAYFVALAERLRHVRMTCRDWTGVLRDSVTVSHGITGVYLDPCYDLATGRSRDIYGIDEPEQSAEVRAWALEHGEHPRLRIVLSGLEGEHAQLEEHGWAVIEWRGRERLWLSPHCRTSSDGPLFSEVEAA